MTTRFLIAVPLALLASSLNVAAESGGDVHPSTGQVADETRIDGLCGPRAVQRVLAWYGIDAELHALAAEIQPLAENSSMAALQDALGKRGIDATAFDVGSSIRIHCSRPAIVHLRGRNGFEHFAVVLPQGTSTSLEGQPPKCAADESCLWLGPDDVQCVPDELFGDLRSGPVLLTAKTGAETAENCLQQAALTSRLSRVDVLLFAAIPALCVVALFNSAKRRRRNRHEPRTYLP